MTKMGDMGPLNGLLFCDTCGHKLYLSRAAANRQYQYFVCGNYRTMTKNCTNHNIRTDTIEKIILNDIRRVVAQVVGREKEFVETLTKANKKETEQNLRKAKAELTKAENRITALDRIIRKLYEDNLNEKLSDERFASMLADYETEQAELKEKVVELKSTIDEVREQNANTDKFIRLVKQHTEIPELTGELVREFIERVEVGQGEWVDCKIRGKKRQTITITYNYVGVLPSLEE
jgi:type I site-specific restriction endonuclease